MNPIEVATVVIGIIGAISGAIGSYAALRNANTGKQNAMIQTSTFLQNEVKRLNDENDELRRLIAHYESRDRPPRRIREQP